MHVAAGFELNSCSDTYSRHEPPRLLRSCFARPGTDRGPGGAGKKGAGRGAGSGQPRLVASSTGSLFVAAHGIFVDPDTLQGQTFTAPAVLAASVAARRAAQRRGKQRSTACRQSPATAVLTPRVREAHPCLDWAAS